MLVAPPAYVPPAVAANPIHGDDPTPRRLKAELTALRNELRTNRTRGPIIERMTKWYNLFCQELQDNPDFDIKKGTQIYARELAEIFRIPRGPDGIQPPLPAELFDATPPPLIQHIVKMLRNERSLFYCQEFDEEGARVLAAVPLRKAEEEKKEDDVKDLEPPPARNLGISPDIIERLRLAKLNLAGRALGRGTHQAQAQRIFSLRLRQEAMAADKEMRRIAELHLAESVRLREVANAAALRHHQVIDLSMRQAVQMLEEAHYLLAEIPEIRNQNRANAQNIIQVERGNQQLQQNINTFREETQKKKSSWLQEVGCLVASVAISWALNTPVHITALPI